MALSWAWLGMPMAGRFTLNCTVPPNMLATIAVPVPGLASPTITEGDAAVWKAGAFVPGVYGVTTGHEHGSTIVFQVGSGSFTFKTASANRQLPPVSGCGSDTVLQCPQGTAVSHVVRAGLAPSRADADTFMAAPSSGLRPALTNRYLVTHVLENLCSGRNVCKLGAVRPAVAPAVLLPLGDVEEAPLLLCAALSCQ